MNLLPYSQEKKNLLEYFPNFGSTLYLQIKKQGNTKYNENFDIANKLVKKNKLNVGRSEEIDNQCNLDALEFSVPSA